MRPQFIMFLAFCLLVGNLLCAVMDGVWLGAEDASLMAYLTGMTNLQTASWTAIFTVPFNLFIHGIPKLLLWDFSFFYGSWGIIRWILLVISIGAIWALAQEFRGSITSIFGRR